MKRITALLINPYIEDFTAYDLWIKPLGLYKLSYVLKKVGFDIKFIDLLDMSHPSVPVKFSKKRENGSGKFYFEYIQKPEILPKIERRFKRYGIPLWAFKEELKSLKDVEIVLITSTIAYWYRGIRTTISVIKEIFGNIPIVVGGIYPTLYYEHSKTIGASFIVKGSFEENLPPIFEIVFGKKFNFDFEIFPDYSISRDKTSMAVQTSKGCPYNCSYCASKKIEPVFFQYPLEYNLKNFEILKNLKIKNIAFYDDALLYNKVEHLKKILKNLKERDFNFCFHTPNGLDPKEIDEELAYLFKEMNFKTIRLSVDFLNKKIRSEKLKEVMESFFKAGYKVGEIEAYILVGFPEQNFEEIKEALFDLFNLKIKSKFAYLSPIEGTGIWKILKEKGYVKDGEDPLLSNKLIFPYRFKGISPEELKKLKDLQNNLNFNLK